MDTTGNGVPEVVPAKSSGLDDAAPETQEVSISARDLKLLEIRQRISEERSLQEEDNSGSPAASAGDATPAGEKPAATATPTPTKKADTFDIFEKDGQQFVRLKAYGQVEELPLETALRRAQKDVAAERKLADVTVRERRVAASEEQLNQRLQKLQSAPPVQQTAQPDLNLKATLEKLYNGDVDSAAAELELAIKGRQTATPITPDVISATVKQELRTQSALTQQAQYEAELVTAAAVFEEEFAELAKDKRLSGYVDRETEILMQENPGMPLVEVIRTAAATVKNLVAPKVAPPPPPTPEELRLDAKRNAPRPNPGVRVPSVSTQFEPPPKPKTTGDVIASMRQLRGQAPK